MDLQPRGSRRRYRRFRVAAVLVLLSVGAAVAEEAPDARHLLVLLRGIEQEYREAFDASGALVRPIELEEAGLLLAEARERVRRMSESNGDLDSDVASLGEAVDHRAPVEVVVAHARELSKAVREATGVADQMLPSQTPSAARGSVLFAQNCTSCHGVHGAGDGPDAEKRGLHPADFTDPMFMRDETPADFFLVISLGRRRASMPAWEDALSVQDRWDLVSYVWSLRGGAAHLENGWALYAMHCERCHPMQAGAGAARASVPAASLASLERMAARSDGEIDTAIADGVEGSEMTGLDVSEPEISQLVAFTRSLSLGPPVPLDPRAVLPDPSVRLERALERVAQQVVAAVNAYRLRENDAAALAAAAYLDFEPLEPSLAARDPSAVYRVESDFVRLQKALRKKDATREVDDVTASLKRALDAARTATHAGRGAPFGWIALGVAIGAGGLAALLIVFRRG